MKLLSLLQAFWKRFLPFGAAVFPWAGGLCLALAAGFGLHSWLAVRELIHAQATVIENVATQAADGTVTYATHLRFRLPAGQIVTFTDPIQSSQYDDPSFAAGSTVPIVYLATNPRAASIATVWRIYSTAILFGIFGVAFVDLGIILRRLYRLHPKI
jgi:hypothetical protein